MTFWLVALAVSVGFGLAACAMCHRTWLAVLLAALLGGLLAPHLANMLGARLPHQQLTAAALIGATVMVLADWLGRQIGFPYEIPAGLMATLLGGGYFLLIMRRM